MTTSQDGPHTLGRWIGEGATLNPQRVALEYCDEKLTYGELEEQSRALAAGLVAAGLQPHDRIATLSENRPEQIVLFLACARARLALAPLNWRLTAAELAAQLEILRPSRFFAGSDHIAKASEGLTAANLPGEPCPLEPLEALSAGTYPKASVDLSELSPVADDDPMLIVFTSGSTGRPKGAVLTHANCFWTNVSLDGTVPLEPDDVVLQVLPQCHVGGWNVQPLQALWKGATLLLEPRFDPGLVLAHIERRRVTTMMGVPTTYLFLSEQPRFAEADLSSLRTVVVGGAAMPVALLETWQRRGVDIVQGYGLTEAAPNVLCLPPEEAARHHGSAGKPYNHVEVELRDPESGQFLSGPGTGEICVRGPNVFAGYFEDAEATAAAVDGDGWLSTGDLAERDDEGFYSIRGRTVEMFVSGGENVYPAEVENVLAGHEEVIEAAVVGIPHPRWGECGLAFVVPRTPGLSSRELAEHCRQLLAAYKVPGEFRFVAELPKTSAGKVDRQVLRKEAAAVR